MQDLATQTLFKNKCLEKYALLNSLTKSSLHWPYKKSHDPLYTTATTKKKLLQQNAVHDQQLVSH